jgi:hypothetical protein
MWDELGIAPCDDPKAIRRAYAARLKQLDPDRNPQAFERLRRAFERALSGACGNDDPPSSRPPRGTDHDNEPATEQPSAPHAETAHEPAFQPSAPTPDHDDIRDQALLIALDAALRRRDAAEATALYYRAAATGALSLDSAPDVIERLLAVAVDDLTIGAAVFRGLVRAAGLDTPRSRPPVAPELRQRVLARLRAEDWYDNLLVTAQQRKGKVARRRAKITRLILGRIGRHWHPRVDKAALRTWLAQYKSHEAWLKDRIDPAWISKLEGRLRRRDIIWLVFYILFVGGMLFQFMFLSIFAVTDWPESLWALLVAPLAVAFLLWILKLLLAQLLTLSFPGWTRLASRGRAIWNRLKGKKPRDVG